MGFRRFVAGYAFGEGGYAVDLRATAVFAECLAPERPLGGLAPCETLLGAFFGGIGCRQRRERFAGDLVSEIGIHDTAVFGAQAHHYGVFGVLHGPESELRLVIEFCCDGPAAVDAQRFALPFFPGVGDRGVFGGIVDAQRGVGLLRFGDDVEAPRADSDLGRIGTLGDVGHGVGKDILLRVARESVDHREIALFDPFRRYREMFFRTIRNVPGRVGRRAVVFRSIDAEHREVARVAGPDPVVGVAPELADRRGRRGHEAHVVELLVDEQELLVAVVHLFDRGFVARAFGFGFADDLLRRLACGDPVGHIVHADEEADPEFFVRQLLGPGHGPETIGQVVVLDGRMFLNGVVAAMVVGEQQAFGRDEFARTAAVEEHDGVLHRGLVDRVDVFGREAEAFCAHVVDAFGDQAREPHALVGQCGQEGEGGEQGQQGTFHEFKNLSNSVYTFWTGSPMTL